jgi:hypothetical protein
LEPCTCTWQFVQLPAMVKIAPPEDPPGSDLEVRATDGWPAAL